NQFQRSVIVQIRRCHVRWFVVASCNSAASKSHKRRRVRDRKEHGIRSATRWTHHRNGGGARSRNVGGGNRCRELRGRNENGCPWSSVPLHRVTGNEVGPVHRQSKGRTPWRCAHRRQRLVDKRWTVSVLLCAMSRCNNLQQAAVKPQRLQRIITS